MVKMNSGQHTWKFLGWVSLVGLHLPARQGGESCWVCFSFSLPAHFIIHLFFKVFFFLIFIGKSERRGDGDEDLC